MWNKLSAEHERLGGSYFDAAMRNLVLERPAFLPSLDGSQELFVCSDTGGEHRASRFTTFSFVILPVERLASWNRQVVRIRQKFGLRDRRIGYSRLGDRRRRAAVAEFCVCSNAIPGLSVSVVVDKRIESIFKPTGWYMPSTVKMGERAFDRWRPAVFERALRAAYFVALFLAGVSAPGQNVTWISDEDDVAANENVLADLVSILAYFHSQLSAHPLGQVRVGTTAHFNVDRSMVEDLTAIADLIAGGVSELVGSYGGDIPLCDVIALAPEHLPVKARGLVGQMFSREARLAKLIFTIEKVVGTTALRYGCPAIQTQPRLIQLG